MRYWIALASSACLGLTAIATWPDRLSAASTTLVIGEFRTRGPSGGSDEFIEIRNVSGVLINLNGWSIVGSNGSGVTETRANLSNVTLGPGCAWLLGNSNTNGYTGPVNQTYAVGITDDGGIALAGPGGIVDAVGLSVGSAFGEGTKLPNFGSTNSNRSYERGGDTDNNAADFHSPVSCGSTGTGRVTVNITDCAGTVGKRSVGVVVNGTSETVVERATYYSAGGLFASGGAALATPIP